MKKYTRKNITTKKFRFQDQKVGLLENNLCSRCNSTVKKSVFSLDGTVIMVTHLFKKKDCVIE